MAVAVQADMVLTHKGNNKAPAFQAGTTLIGKLLGADMNSVADQSIPMLANTYIIRKIVFQNASINLTTAAGGIYTAAAKGGTAVVPAIQVYAALTAASKYIDAALHASTGTDVFTQAALILSLTTAQGAAATCDIYIYGDALN